MQKILLALALGGLLASVSVEQCPAQRLARPAFGQQSASDLSGSTSVPSAPDTPDTSDQQPGLNTGRMLPAMRNSAASSSGSGGGNGHMLRGFASDQYAPDQQNNSPPAGTLRARAGADFGAFSADAADNTLRSGANNNALRAGANQDSSPIMGVTQRDLKLLGQHDIIVLIDKSSSMKEHDCPSFFGRGIESRWEWCQEQTAALAQATANVLPQGLSVVLFSTGLHVFPRVTLADVPRIFTSYSPGGFTNEAGAIESTFGDYFRRRDQNHGKVKPILVAVITDGLPTDRQGVRDAVIDATHNLHSPDEIKLTFLQVGTDPKGIGFAREMDHGLVHEGASADIVSSKVFPDLLRGGGLTRALADCLSEHGGRYSTAQAP